MRKSTSTPEQVEQQIKEAVERALADAGIDLKRRELEIKERKAGSEIRSPYIDSDGALAEQRSSGSEGLAEVQQNTSPMNPAVPQQGGTGMEGIETERVSDNLK